MRNRLKGLRIVVAGYVVRYPLGGQAWAHLQYVFGLKRLGCDVYFLEDAGWENSCYDPSRGITSNSPNYGVGFLSRIMRRQGLGDSWAYRDAKGRLYGMTRRNVNRLLKGEFVLVDLSAVSWFHEFERAQRKLYIDEDPAFPQFSLAAGEQDLKNTLARYDVHFTYGRSVGQPGCAIPSAGLDWLPTNQPIVLDLWKQPAVPDSGPFTTVMNWTSYANVEYDGEVYGQKDVEFEKVIDLPSKTGANLELALGGVNAPSDRLRTHGWRVADPLMVTKSMDSYRRYIYNSRGEFSVAKNAYVKTRSGWFSDRSAAYMASGRPVILQDTGYTDWLQSGRGVVPFTNLEEAVEALENVNADWNCHSFHARRLAEEHFASDRVLSSLLERGGVS